MTGFLETDNTYLTSMTLGCLEDMGFSVNAAKKAALINFNNEENAIDWLTSKERPDLDEPLGDFNFFKTFRY